jgi:ribosome maturation factor RimP
VLTLERTRALTLGHYAVGSPRAEVVERIRQIAGRVAGSYGLELFDVQLRRESGGWLLRVILDRPGEPAAPAGGVPDGVTIADCQRVSHDLSAILDVEGDETLGDDAFERSYTLEVSSPGLDRPLRHEADYRRFTGRLAKVVVSEAVDGQKAFAGRIQGVEDGVVLLTEGRRTHRIPLAQVTRARLEVEF